MEVLALLHISAAIFISSLNKSANTKDSQYDFSGFLVHPVSLVFERWARTCPQVQWWHRPCVRYQLAIGGYTRLTVVSQPVPSVTSTLIIISDIHTYL